MTRAITIFISFIGNIGMTAFAKKRFVSSYRQHLAVCGYYLSVFISLLSDFIYNIILYYKWFVGSQYSEQFSWIAKLLHNHNHNPSQTQSQPITTTATTPTITTTHNHNDWVCILHSMESILSSALSRLNSPQPLFQSTLIYDRKNLLL